MNFGKMILGGDKEPTSPKESVVHRSNGKMHSTQSAKSPTSPKADASMGRSISVPAISTDSAPTSPTNIKIPPGTPKWLAQEMREQAWAAEAQEKWRADANLKLDKLREKDSLNDALNAFILQLKRECITEVELFQKIDANGDGELSRGEMQTALRRLGIDLSSAELDGILRVFDTDGSGTIDFSEFAHLLKSQEEHLPQSVDAMLGREIKTGYDPMHGFTEGERCKLVVSITNKFMQGDPYAQKRATYCTVLGMGKKPGMMQVMLEEKETMLLVRAEQLSKVKPPKP